MKTVRVVAAIIKAVNENGEPIIFATQRGYGDFKGDGNSRVERLRKVKPHKQLLFVRYERNLKQK